MHPAPAEMLAEWRTKGCAEMLKAPEPDDLPVPAREGNMRSRHHTPNELHEDLARLDLR